MSFAVASQAHLMCVRECNRRAAKLPAVKHTTLHRAIIQLYSVSLCMCEPQLLFCVCTAHSICLLSRPWFVQFLHAP